MATIVVNRSDLFPENTVVKAYAGVQASSWSTSETLKGTAKGEGTVTSAGKLTIGEQAEGQFTLFAEVSSENRYLRVSTIPYNSQEPSRGVLRTRIKERREAAGAL
jgi:hypothetical protein